MFRLHLPLVVLFLSATLLLTACQAPEAPPAASDPTPAATFTPPAHRFRGVAFGNRATMSVRVFSHAAADGSGGAGQWCGSAGSKSSEPDGGGRVMGPRGGRVSLSTAAGHKTADS